MVAGAGGPRSEVYEIAFLRRLLGGRHTGDRTDTSRAAPTPQPLTPATAAVPAPPPAAPPVACPYCATVLDPPPPQTRLCPRCRRRIVVRHVDGRAAYLTEAAVAVFEAEREREVEAQTWTRQRREWLRLAQSVDAPADRRRRLAAAPLTAPSVQAARSLYIGTVERAVRAARRAHHWEEVARLRQRQAAALFEEAGGTAPPGEEVVALYRDGLAATLRALSAVAKEVELVSAGCCPACRADDEHIFRIADELRTPRLPHAGCPRGLCACDWWPAVRKPRTAKRRRRSAPAPPASPSDGA